VSAVARRYATALFALAKEAGALSPSAEELARAAALAGEPSVAAVLGSPLLSATQRRDFAQTLAGEVQASPLLARCIALLADHQRLDELPAIHRRFQELLDQDLGRVRVTVRSASAPSAAQQAELVGAFAAITGKHVVPTVVVDPELLGGVVVEAEGKVYDGSLRTQFDRLAKALTGAPAP
jgi:F-type H+-transporting ATPase subunit delta